MLWYLVRGNRGRRLGRGLKEYDLTGAVEETPAYSTSLQIAPHFLLVCYKIYSL